MHAIHRPRFWPGASLLVILNLLVPGELGVQSARAQSAAATASANASVGGTPGAATAAAPRAGAVVIPPAGAVPAPQPGTTAAAPAVAPDVPPPAAVAAPPTTAPAIPAEDPPLTVESTGSASGPAAPATVVPQPAGVDPQYFQEMVNRPNFPIRAERDGFFATAGKSIFGPADYAPWTPLPLRTFFSEGWRDAWIAPPNGSGGAPRQGWIGAADGNFYRLYWLSYIEAFHTSGAPNGYTQRVNIYTPLSRRLLLITTIPSVNANTPSFNLGTADFGSSGAAIRGQAAKGTGTSFGDLTITPRFMLKETQDLSLSMQLTVQIPTGRTGSGAGKAIITPGIQFWRDIGRGWAIRGGFNSGTGVNNPARGETLVSQLAIGQTITPHDKPIFGDLTYYLATNISNQLAPKAATTVTLGPGYRTHLGNDWYSLGAVTVPVTGPHPFDESLTLWLMKTF